MQTDSPKPTPALHQAQIFDSPPCAREILSAALGVSQDKAGKGLIALFKAGFFIGPMEPTNSMLLAYLEALPAKPKKNDTVLAAVAKARRRWKAMAEAGNKVAMSERGGMVDAADLKSVGATHAGSSPAARTNGANDEQDR